MTPVEWETLQNIVLTAVDLSPAKRKAYLADRCGEDEALRQQAEKMLSAYLHTDASLQNAIGLLAAQMASPVNFSMGDRIGPYRIVCIIGHGGMSTVYRAQRSDDQFQQSVAVKVVHAGFVDNTEKFARFRAERQILADINHPNIARLLDGGVTTTGLPYLVMEYIEGQNLDEYAEAHKLSTEARLGLFRQLCAAVQHAHQNLIVHRDLKPANVMVTTDGIPKLLDFGIAKLLTPAGYDESAVHTRPAERLMTPEYASPEQIRGEAITTAADIYGLGVLLYELLTGSRPFRIGGLSPGEIERLICDTAPAPPSTVRSQAPSRPLGGIALSDLDRIVLKALHKTPARRYSSANDFSADIERYLSGFPVTARPDSMGYRASRFVSRHWLAVSAASLFVITVIGLSIGLALQARRAQREAQSADAVSLYLVSLFDFSQPNATQGRSVSARDILDQGTERLNNQWKGDPVVKARLLNTLGTVYYKLGALDRGIALLREAESLYSTAAGPDSMEVAHAATNLGDILETKGDYVGCMEQYLKALAIFEKKKGHSSVEVADELDGIGSLHWVGGDYLGAERYRQESIEIFTRLLGPEAKETLLAKGNLEVVLAAEGKYREAEPLAREILRERTRIFGPVNSYTNIALANLASILMKTARFEEARPMLEQTLTVARKLYGEEHPDVGAALADLGKYHLEMGHLDMAKGLLEQGHGIAVRTAGPQSFDAASDEDALSSVLLEMGDLAAAREWEEKALTTRLGARSPSLPMLSQSYDHLGLIDLAHDDLPAARHQIEHALELRKKAYSTENDSIAMSYSHLGAVFRAQNDLDGAQQAYAQALRAAQNNFGATAHPITAEALYGTGLVLLQRHEDPKARSILKDALRMQQKLYPDGHPALRNTIQALRSATK